MYQHEPKDETPPAGEGHNRVGGIEPPRLRAYIERVERLATDKADIASDICDVFAEAKSNGFDVKAMREILKLRKLKANERTEQEYMLDLYKRALGMEGELQMDIEDALDSTPQKEAANG